MRITDKAKRALAVTAATCATLMGVSALNQHDVQAASNASLNPAIASATTTFGVNMLHKIAEVSPTENVFISPASIALCLDLVYNGAQADTATAMAKTLGLAGISMADVNNSNRALMDMMTSADPKVKVMVANSIWAKKSVNFKSEFINRCKTSYKAQAATLDFNGNALKEMNGWVNKNTNGMIPSIIDSIDPLAVMFLINTVYFKGDWQFPYEPTATHPDTFHLLGGKSKQVKKMHGAEKYLNYLETDQFQMVRLPYGDGRFGMYVLLPGAKVDYKTFLGAMKSSDWRGWCKKMGEMKGSVDLPKFKISFKSTLNTVLSQMGMAVAFDAKNANFKGISDQTDNIYISQVIHAATMKVDEQGTEAAAATAIAMCGAGAPMPDEKKFHMDVNRPFIVGLTDSKTGELLFLGSVVNPE